MLGPDRFAFETPNVIDPGDLPPSQPARKVTTTAVATTAAAPPALPRYQADRTQRLDMENTVATKKDGDDGDDDHDESLGFLAADEKKQQESRRHRDKDVNPNYNDRGGGGGGFRHYRYRDNYSGDNDMDDNHHSLPAIEEARTYAASLLHSANKTRSDGSSSQDPFARTNTASRPFSIASGGRQQSIDRNRDERKNMARRQLLGKILCYGSLLVLFSLILVGAVRLSRRGIGGDDDVTVITDTPVEEVQPPSRLELAQNFIRAALLSDPEDLITPGRPQFQAANWIAHMDVLELPIPTALSSSMEAQPFIQRYALATLFYATKGNQAWIHKVGFLSDQLECGWFDSSKELMPKISAQHNNRTYSLGVTCNLDLQVVGLVLPSNGLEGSLPPELGYLTNLKLLALPHNQLTDTIPDTLVNLVQLEYLDLKFNFLKGRVPDIFQTLSNLQILGLSNNYLEQKLPPSLKALTKLKTLALDDNLFVGNLDPVNYLHSLQFLYLDRNSFSGPINDAFLANLPNLLELDLSGNQFTSGGGGTFPKHLLQHDSLHILDCADNHHLAARLPADLQKNIVLKFLSLRDTNLTGQVSPTSLPMLEGLNHLDISGNQLTGMLPNTMKHLTNLEFLFVGRNPFQAKLVPDWLYLLKNLRELSLTDMQLTGEVPAWLEELKSLSFLDLSHNSLQNDVPTQVFDLPNLQHLLLHNNSLTGPIPESFAGSEKIQLLTLFDNQGFTGNLDHICRDADALQLLAADCSANCSKSCCLECCDRQATAGVNAKCFEDIIPVYLQFFEGMWELNYTRTTSPFDPSLIVDQQPKDNP